MSQYALYYFPWSLGQYHSYNLSQLPGSRQPIMCNLFFKDDKPPLPSTRIYLYSWVKRSNYGVVLKDTATIRTHILTTRPSQHKSNALNCT